MIKKIEIIGVLILFCSSIFAQNKMDKATFEHMVDYANCQYLMTFIEKNDAGKSYIKDTYKKSVKLVLQTATLDNLNTVPDFDKIKGLFSNVPNKSALKLALKINERKGEYESSPDNNSLVECLKADKWQGDKGTIDLNSTATQIQNSIKTKFKAAPSQQSISFSKQGFAKNKTVQTPSQVDTLRNKIENLEQQYDTFQNDLKIEQETISTLRLWGIISLVLIVLLIVALLLWYKLQFNVENSRSSVRKFVKEIFFTSKEIKEKFENIKKTTNANGDNNNVSMFEDKINKLERQLGELYEKVRSIKTGEVQNIGLQQAPQKTNNLPQQTNIVPQSDKAFYFASKSNKQLIEKLPNSTNASFKIFAINGNEAEFKYVGAVRNENWFEGVCSIENSANDNLSDKKHISTTQPGKVKNENDNWIVIIPAIIKFV